MSITNVNEIILNRLDVPAIDPTSAPEAMAPTTTISSSIRAGQRRLKGEAQLQNRVVVNAAAANLANEELVKILIEYGNNPNGYSAIVWATHLGHQEVVRKLIAYGVDYKNEGVPGVGNLLDIAIKNKHLGLAELFLEKGIRNFSLGNYCNALDSIEVLEFLENHKLLNKYKTVNDLAVFLENGMPIAGIRFLVEHGADCSSKVTLPRYKEFMKAEEDIPGILAVVWDCRKFEPDFVKFLVDHGAPINTNLKLQPTWNPLLITVWQASAATKKDEIEKWNDLIEFLIDHGAKWPDDSSYQYRSTINFINKATRNRNLDFILLMTKVCNCLEFSAVELLNPDYPKASPEIYVLTPLQHAVFENRVDDARRLLQHGANPNNPGTFNFLAQVPQHGLFTKTPISIAIKNKNTEMVDLLLNHGAKI